MSDKEVDSDRAALLERVRERMEEAYAYIRKLHKLGNGNTTLLLKGNLEAKEIYWYAQAGLGVKHVPTGQPEVRVLSTPPLPIEKEGDVFRRKIFPGLAPGNLPDEYLICDSQIREAISTEFQLEQIEGGCYVLPRGVKYPAGSLDRQFNSDLLEKTTRYPFTIYVVDTSNLH